MNITEEQIKQVREIYYKAPTYRYERDFYGNYHQVINTYIIAIEDVCEALGINLIKEKKK